MSRRPDLGLARACILLALAASIAFHVLAGPPAARAQAAKGAEVALELVQTVPVDTALGLPGLRDTHAVWLELIDGARERIDLAHFYAVEHPGEPDGDPGAEAAAEDEPATTRLTPVVAALERAAARGVRVRFLADRGFHATYPDLLDRLGALEGVEVRLYDLRALTGGVLHAKVMLVDGRAGFLGSPNFDWRSLEHVQELGVRFTGTPLAAAFGSVYERDWRQAADASERIDFTDEAARAAARAFPVQTADGGRVTPVMSPEGLLPAPELWDLPRIVALVDGAGREVALQLLSYRPRLEGEPWTALDDALRRAAARGVRVRLLLSHWATRASSLGPLRELHALENVEVRFLTVPEHASGFLPFARVAHAKLLVVDGGAAGWIGTSNGSGDYFHASRNVGLVVTGGEVPAQLARYLDVGWSSPHAAPLDPARDYPEPRVAE